MGSKGTLQRLLINAEDQLWSDFDSAGEFANHGDKGNAREVPLRNFLQRRLPSKYCVRTGEAVDCLGNQTGQIDIVIYDGSSTCPLLTKENGVVLLPAEALLATVEVKTTLTGPELDKALAGVGAVYGLNPWKKPWGVARKNGAHANDQLPRVFASIFAYQTSLSEANWAEKEMKRLRQRVTSESIEVNWIDRVAVLNRGLILPESGKVAQKGQKGVLGLWFFSLINFLDREVARRREFPWAQYEIPEKNIWKTVP